MTELSIEPASDGRARPTLVIAGTFTVDPLVCVVQAWLDRACAGIAVRAAPYSQLFQALLDPSSAMRSNRQGCNVLLVRYDDWRRNRPASSGDDEAGFLRATAAELGDALQTFARAAASPTLVVICPAGSDAVPEGGDLCAELGAILAGTVAGLASVSLVHAGDYDAGYPVAHRFDATRDELAHIPYSDDYMAVLAMVIARRSLALVQVPCKVIVADCDGTLWQGACGELGPDGVTLDDASRGLQRRLAEQRDQGVLVCLCSKNTDDDVWRVFEGRTDMVLRREHIVDARINWEPKSANLRELARALDVGLDTFVFIDDNPIECAEVRAHHPEVLVLQLPCAEQRRTRFTDDIWLFDDRPRTREDARRSEMMCENLQRSRSRAGVASLQDFLAGLELEVSIAPATDGDAARIAQL
ncbi:MAG TPA: HAD-IIIC family phosphatase, partial [Kofleriaceae bacterium]|nr:HAD-IIIC family phosphatase [Kofleriaceae bacterium]